MKEFIFKNIGFALFLFVTIILIFLFADLKMENAYLSAEVEDLRSQVNDLNTKLNGIGNSYRDLMASYITRKIIKLDDIIDVLPEYEINMIKQRIADK